MIEVEKGPSTSVRDVKSVQNTELQKFEEVCFWSTSFATPYNRSKVFSLSTLRLAEWFFYKSVIFGKVIQYSFWFLYGTFKLLSCKVSPPKGETFSVSG